MNAIHPAQDANRQESVSPNVSAHKLKSWELRDFVTEYQTYPSPGAAAVASRLAARYNSEKGYSYETQRQIADITGFTRSAVAQYLDEIESTGLWTFVHGKPGTATRYAPIAIELGKAKMFIEYRMAGRLSSFPYPKVPNFKRPKGKAGQLKGIAKVSSDAKKTRDIREAAEAAALETVAAVVPPVGNTSAPETEYEISAYSPDDMPEFVIPEEPADDYDAPFDPRDPYLSRPPVEFTEHTTELSEHTNTDLDTLTTTTSPVVIDDGCPF